MTWEKYITKHKGIGTLCEVMINKKDSLIKRTFSHNSNTVSGKPTRFKARHIDIFFENEVRWLRELEGEWIPKTIEIDVKRKSIIQEFYSEDLLCFRKQLPEIIPDLNEQIIEMYKFFAKKNVFKRNGSLSNLTHKNGRIKAFDFKWSMPRPMGLGKEIYSYDHYLVKINNDLPSQLKKLL